MNKVADRGLRIADSGMANDARLQPALNRFSPSIHPAASRYPVASRDPQSSVRNPPSIELHIEELVLHGFAPGDRHHIADAIERELAGLFTGRDVPPSLMQDGEIGRLDGGAFDVAPNSKAGATGSQIARAVYEGLIR